MPQFSPKSIEAASLVPCHTCPEQQVENHCDRQHSKLSAREIAVAPARPSSNLHASCPKGSYLALTLTAEPIPSFRSRNHRDSQVSYIHSDVCCMSNSIVNDNIVSLNYWRKEIDRNCGVEIVFYRQLNQNVLSVLWQSLCFTSLRVFFEIIFPDLMQITGAKWCKKAKWTNKCDKFKNKCSKKCSKMWQIRIFDFADLGSLLVAHNMHNSQVGRECVLGAARGASVTYVRPNCMWKQSAETSTSTDLEWFWGSIRASESTVHWQPLAFSLAFRDDFIGNSLSHFSVRPWCDTLRTVQGGFDLQGRHALFLLQELVSTLSLSSSGFMIAVCVWPVYPLAQVARSKIQLFLLFLHFADYADYAYTGKLLYVVLGSRLQIGQQCPPAMAT